MLIGIPKEIKDHEYRVGATPAGVRELVGAGHQVIVQKMPVLRSISPMINMLMRAQKLWLQLQMSMDKPR